MEKHEITEVARIITQLYMQQPDPKAKNWEDICKEFFQTEEAITEYLTQKNKETKVAGKWFS